MPRPNMSIKQRVSTKGVLWMAGRKCHLCGGAIYRFSQATLDHIIARSAGGSDDLDNIALAHRPCNELRGNMTMESWVALRPNGQALVASQPTNEKPSRCEPRGLIIERNSRM